MEHADLVGGLLREPGVEIGAFLTPIPNIRPIYVDRFSQYANQPTLANYYGDACDLPFEDSSLGYVASSHVIEHVANPLAAFKEWYRVLKHNGIIYMVVPDRRLTFDRPRALTPVAHMVEDYRLGVTQVDGTHIDDFVFGVDWSVFSPETRIAEMAEAKKERAGVYRAAIAGGSEINIHFHTFEPPSMQQLIAESARVLKLKGGIEFLRTVPEFPTSNPIGFLVVARVKKAWTERVRGAELWPPATYPLKREARKFVVAGECG